MSQLGRRFVWAFLVATASCAAPAPIPPEPPPEPMPPGTGSIVGHVHDQAGQPLMGVRVRVSPDGRPRAHKVTYSRDDGFFRVPALAPGRYVLTADAPRLRPHTRKDIVVAADAAAEIEVVVEAEGRAEESVTVMEKAPAVSSARSPIREGFDMDFVQSMPHDTRDSVISSAPPVSSSPPSPPPARSWSRRADGSSIQERHSPPPGLLTAGLWDDNLNFGFYQRYLRKTAAHQPAGLPDIPRDDRFVIDVVDADGFAVRGAALVVDGGQRARRFQTITAGDGRSVYLPRWMGASGAQSLRVSATLDGVTARASAPASAGYLKLQFPARLAKLASTLDIAFMVDTTGSMSDEIRYLQSELDAIAGALDRRFPRVRRRWALVVYRDDGDEYVTRSYDFTTDLAAFKRRLAAQHADGGGDEPESPERALAAANALSWSGGRATRVLFWVADAPHHDGRQRQMAEAIFGAVTRGTRIYPVASSGANDLAEWTMRTAAQVTGGRYLFLTDDSGVGLPHAEPRIPCYYVTSLQAAMKRVLSMELEGRYLEPLPAEVVRTGGNPQHHRCPLRDGQTVAAF
jgi:hypothetical protein